jgi:hypothetical protein
MKRVINCRLRHVRRAMCIGLIALCPVVAGPSCASGDRLDAARTNAAPAVANVFGALGDVIGHWVAAMMTPVSSNEPSPSS